MSQRRAVIKAHSRHSALELTWWGTTINSGLREYVVIGFKFGFANFSITKPYSGFEISLLLYTAVRNRQDIVILPDTNM